MGREEKEVMMKRMEIDLYTLPMFMSIALHSTQPFRTGS